MTADLSAWCGRWASTGMGEDLAEVLWLASLSVLQPGTSLATPARPVPPKPPGGRQRTDSEAKLPISPPALPNALERSPVPPSGPGLTGPGGGHSTAALTVDDHRESAEGRAGGLTLTTPTGRALPGAREIARALRPLRRRVPSRTTRVLDEERTVRQVAETKVWMPMVTPERSRWLELALVVDESASLELWRDTIRELQRLLERMGAFRDVRRWRMDTSLAEAVTLRPGIGSSVSAASQLLVPDARRLVLVVSDCTGPAWNSGRVAPVLQLWGAHQPTALWQLLPASFWRRTGLNPATGPAWVEVGSTEAGSPNCRLPRRLFRARAGAPAPRGIPIPVLTATPQDIKTWVDLLTRPTSPRVPGVLWRSPVAPLSSELGSAAAAPTPPPVATARAAQSISQLASSPLEQVLYFQRLVSPEAMALTRRLAAAPLRLPVMRLVQQVLLPHTTQLHLAELFLSGLLVRRTPPAITDPHRVDYDFPPGVRDLLLDSSEETDPIDVQKVVSDYLEDRLGRTEGGLAARVELPGMAGRLAVPAADREFARVQASVLSRLGGRFKQAADELRRQIPPPPVVDFERRPATNPGSPGAYEGREILWADDHPENNENEIERLTRGGATVILVKSTKAALEYLTRLRVDAVLSDIGRGKEAEAGLELLAQVRALGFAVPVGFYSVKADRYVSRAQGAFVCAANFREVRDALLSLWRQQGSPWPATSVPAQGPSLPMDRMEAVVGVLVEALKEANVDLEVAQRWMPNLEQMDWQEFVLSWPLQGGRLRLLQLVHAATNAVEVGLWRPGRRKEFVCEVGWPRTEPSLAPERRSILESALKLRRPGLFGVNTNFNGTQTRTELSFPVRAGSRGSIVAVLLVRLAGNPPGEEALQWVAHMLTAFAPKLATPGPSEPRDEAKPVVPAENNIGKPQSPMNTAERDFAEQWRQLNPSAQLALAVRFFRRGLESALPKSAAASAAEAEGPHPA